MIFNLRDAPGFVGGCYSSNPKDDYSFIPASEQSISTLDKSRLARESLSFVMKPIDSRGSAFDICMRPFNPKGVTKYTLLQDVGTMLKLVANGNGGDACAGMRRGCGPTINTFVYL